MTNWPWVHWLSAELFGVGFTTDVMDLGPLFTILFGFT